MGHTRYMLLIPIHLRETANYRSVARIDTSDESDVCGGPDSRSVQYVTITDSCSHVRQTVRARCTVRRTEYELHLDVSKYSMCAMTSNRDRRNTDKRRK